MNAALDATPGETVDAVMIPPVPAVPGTPVRPFYWSVRRELWENRSITIAPLLAAIVVLLGFLASASGLPNKMRAVLALDVVQQGTTLAMPYGIAAMVVIVTSVFVAVFYCLDALHGERRDRSILFWKSLPVSDRTAVLAKASIPLVVLPLLAFVIVVVVQVVMLLLSTLVLSVAGVGATALWTQMPLVGMTLATLYGLVAFALWYAPVYAWLLLVSAWARRTMFLWAVLPPLAIGIVEKLSFGTGYFASLLQYRLTGVFARAFTAHPQDGVMAPLAQLDPGKFLGTPGLWAGLVAAAAFLAAAVWLRRNREPL
ncbi:MAG: ABC transporter permease [Casimicrobiaceae bacterium]